MTETVGSLPSVFGRAANSAERTSKHFATINEGAFIPTTADPPTLKTSSRAYSRTMMSGEATKPDRDSLMALQALLKIRSDSVVSEKEAVNFNEKNKNASTMIGAASKKNENPRHHDKPPAKQQQHRSHVTPPFGAMSPRSSLSPTFTLNYDAQPPTNAAPYSPVVSMNPVAVPSSGVALEVPSSSGGRNAGSGGPTNAKQFKTKQSDTSDKPIVRTTEIEAALRSKPQRGRKRDNLSELERLELTRTRNREHAKSTRIRKKARHQELLDNEQKYQELRATQELCKKRSECVHCFLSVRESMVRSVLDERKPGSLPANSQVSTQNSSDDNPPSSSNNEVSERGLVSPQRTVKFVQFSIANQSFLSEGKQGPGDNDALRDYVDNESGFEFSTVGGTWISLSSNESQHTDPINNATDAMRNFDVALATRVQELMGKSLAKNLSYTVPRGGVAVNECGKGFAQVIIGTRRNERQHEYQVMNAILKFTFVPNSIKLKSVVWHTTDESFEYSDSDCTSCGSGESLGCQTSFPSVVSLDQSGDTTDQKPPASGGVASDGNGDGSVGPGMNI